MSINKERIQYETDGHKKCLLEWILNTYWLVKGLFRRNFRHFSLMAAKKTSNDNVFSKKKI